MLFQRRPCRNRSARHTRRAADAFGRGDRRHFFLFAKRRFSDALIESQARGEVRPEDVIDLRPDGEYAGLGEILGFSADVAALAAKCVVGGVPGTAGEALEGGMKLLRGDLRGAAGVTVSRVEGIVAGAAGVVESGVTVASADVDAVTKDAPFMTDANKRHFARLCQAGAYVAAGSLLSGDSAPAGTGCGLDGDACGLPGVENGVFTGDAGDLESLTEAGENPDAVHVEDVARSDAVRAEFLNAHGIDDAAGGEVHHVQPLSEGGADAPENMVLIDPEDHAEVTAAHARLYDWRKA